MNENHPAIPLTSTSEPAVINLQNQMPAITQGRSRELNYDTLEDNPRFVSNPYGPQYLGNSRTNYKWN